MACLCFRTFPVEDILDGALLGQGGYGVGHFKFQGMNRD